MSSTVDIPLPKKYITKKDNISNVDYRGDGSVIQISGLKLSPVFCAIYAQRFISELYKIKLNF